MMCNALESWESQEISRLLGQMRVVELRERIVRDPNELEAVKRERQRVTKALLRIGALIEKRV